MSKDSLGNRIADIVARTIGSWRFVIIQSTILSVWLVWNSLKANPFDPYPYILLNLVLSFQAAYATPLIMMSQNRQAEIDRKVLFGDFEIDQKAHQLISEIHKKVHELEGSTNG